MVYKIGNRRKHFLLALSVCSGLFGSVVAAETVTASTNDNYVQRVSFEVMKEAYNRIGIDLQVKFMPGKRALQASNQGKTQAELARIDGIDKKFTNLVKVPVAINAVGASVFTIDKTFDVRGWDSLKPYSIGFRRGHLFAETGTKGMNTMPVKNVELLIDVLLAGRVDVVVTGQITGQMAIKNSGATNVRELTPVLQSYPLFHYVHKSQAALVPKLTEALEQMQSEGRIDQIKADVQAALLAS